MAMKSALSALLTAALLLVAALPGAAAEICSALAEEKLLPGQMPDFTGDPQTQAGQIREIQACLSIRGCYPGNPPRKQVVDGIVGPFTRLALERSAKEQCDAPAEPEPPPPPSPPPVKDDAPPCGDGRQWASWNLTADDVAELESASPQLKAGLEEIKNTDYPSAGLLRQALTFFAVDALQNPQDEAKDAIEQEVRQQRLAIFAKACKVAAANDSIPAWKPRWQAQMYDSFSQEVYGFWPARVVGTKGGPVKPQVIDFGLFRRLGWLAVGIDDDGRLDLPADLEKVAAPQIDMARRFNTNVDLVVHRRLSPEDWRRLMPTIAKRLPNDIAGTLGRRRGGFFDALQYWLFPTPLALPTGAWDGVTLDLEGYPYDDPDAVDQLVSLIKDIRLGLDQQEKANPRSAPYWRIFWRPTRQFHINLMVPYGALVTKTDVGANTILKLAELVPKDYQQDNLDQMPPTEQIDNFIVFLPQFTSVTKKDLRSAVEQAFTRNDPARKALAGDANLSLAVWRLQMIRNIVMMLSPTTWPYNANFYQIKGRQFYDDLIYARNNFGGVGFWPLADNGGENTELAGDVHRIFRVDATDWIPAAADEAANVVSYWRREIFFGIGTVFLLALLYGLAVYWFIELRAFHRKFGFWIMAAAALDILLLFPFLLIFPGLRAFALVVIVIMGALILAALIVLQSIRRTMEENLP